nr:MAG TPA: hypothetical protein [Caudoviricetes sp.]
MEKSGEMRPLSVIPVPFKKRPFTLSKMAYPFCST